LIFYLLSFIFYLSFLVTANCLLPTTYLFSVSPWLCAKIKICNLEVIRIQEMKLKPFILAEFLSPLWRRIPRRRVMTTTIAILFLLSLRLIPLLFPVHAGDLAESRFQAISFYDRHGNLLQEVLSAGANRSVQVGLSHISPYFRDAIIAAEDKNFYRHHGVDFGAVIRAIYQNTSSGRVVSGASTITLQLARLLHPAKRTIYNKLREVFLAWRLEAGMSKDEIMEAYLNRLPMGGNLYGVESGARSYFGISAGDLTLAQATLLASIPNSPNNLNPYHHIGNIKQRQETILNRMADLGMIPQQRIGGVLKEDVLLKPQKASFLAPHLVFRLAGLLPDSVHSVKTTLDAGWQALVCEQIDMVLKQLKNYHVTNAAAILLDNHSGEILAYAGSADYFNTDIDGQYDGVQALRQPGSTLKPFLYMLALEQGFTPGTTHYHMPTGIYSPRNYSEDFHGPVRLREALGNSLNVPAVRVLAKIGVEPFLERLGEYRFTSLDRKADYYGIGLVLGGGEVSLYELARAYLCIARGGDFQPLTAFLDINDVPCDPISSPFSISTPQCNYLITDILSDPRARTAEFGFNSILNLPFPCAAKTGTSHRFCDNWTVGFTRDYTLGVWVGNFDHTPMMKVSGISGAGPLFANIIYLLYRNREYPYPFPAPPGLLRVSLCPLSGQKPGPACPSRIEEWITERDTALYQQNLCTMHIPDGNNIKTVVPVDFKIWAEQLGLQTVRQEGRLPPAIEIIHPRDGAVYYRMSNLAPKFQSINMEARVRDENVRLEWFLNNQRLKETVGNHSFLWEIKPGQYTLQARITESEELSAAVHFQVK
jgi:penicillin-binding protein 1C